MDRTTMKHKGRLADYVRRRWIDRPGQERPGRRMKQKADVCNVCQSSKCIRRGVRVQRLQQSIGVANVGARSAEMAINWSAASGYQVGSRTRRSGAGARQIRRCVGDEPANRALASQPGQARQIGAAERAKHSQPGFTSCRLLYTISWRVDRHMLQLQWLHHLTNLLRLSSISPSKGLFASAR